MKDILKLPLISGFSIAIFALLLCAFLGSIVHKPQTARCYKTKQDMRGLITALDLFKSSHDRYPSSSEGLNILVNENLMKRIPKDPWGNSYIYSEPAKLNNIYSFDLFSSGENKLNDSGTEDDYVSWENIDCFRNENSCLFISTVYYGLPVFFMTLVISLIKRNRKHKN